MTVPTTVSRIDYVGNGAVSTYSFPFKILSSSDLLVSQEATDGTVTTKTLSTDYSVDGVGSASGGSITLTAGALASLVKLSIRRVVTLTQSVDLRNQGAFFAETHETEFDRLVMADQQQQDSIDRSLKFPETDAGSSATTLPGIAQRALGFLAFDASGNPISATAVTGTPVSAFMATVVDDTSAIAARVTLGAAAKTVFNVKESPYLATGLGVADDLTAIRAAITDAQVAGGTVYFPLGTYLVSDELLITKDGVRLIGEAVSEDQGTMGTRLVTNSTSKDIVRVSTSAQNVTGFEISNLSLYGAGSGGTAGSGIRFDSTTAGRSILRTRLCNVHCKNFKQHGIRFDASTATAFIFDVKMEKIVCVNNYGSGLRSDGAVIQVTADRLYSEINGASQIAIVGADQTTNPQGWLLLGYAVGQNPAVAGTAGLYLENAVNITAINIWHESNSNAEFIFKSCKGIKIEAGRVSQSGTCDGAVIGFSGVFAGGNIEINIPGWSNTSSKKRVDLTQFSGGSFTLPIRLGLSADGAMTQADVTGYAAAFQADMVYFAAPQLISRTANIIQNGVTVSGTWTTPAALPKSDLRTAAINTVQVRGYYMGAVEGNALVGAAAPLKGIKPYAVDLIYEVTGGDSGDDVDFTITSQTWAADNVVTPAATAITTTVDAAHSTAAKRSNSSGGHQYNRMTRTITTPAWLGEGEELIVTITATEANDATNALTLKIKAILVYYYQAMS